MCLLNILSNKVIWKDEEYLVAYKAYKLLDIPQCNQHGNFINLDIKLEAVCPKVWANRDYKIYEAGFHGFLAKEDARKYDKFTPVICRVLMREIICIGINGNSGGQPILEGMRGLTIVSKYMVILKSDWESALYLEKERNESFKLNG